MVKIMKNSLTLGSSKVGARGQVTIPKKARDEFGLEPGDVIVFVKEDGNLLIKK